MPGSLKLKPDYTAPYIKRNKFGIHNLIQPAPISSIAVSFTSSLLREKASVLARELNLPLVDLDDSTCQILLVLTGQRLETRMVGSASPGPVFVDLTSPAITYRRRKGGGRRQALAKAIGLKKGRLPQVFDATAGLGRDSFILACLGCTVSMAERSPVLAALLDDGLRRAADNPETSKLIKERLSLIKGNAIEIMRQGKLPMVPEVIYLDPMHPEREKSALVKKEMRILRAVVGKDDDAPELLAAALSLAPRRIAVKRPRKAPAIDGPRPSFTLPGKSSRFDVYLL